MGCQRRPEGDRAKVTWVTDGDTFDVQLESGRHDKVRPIGIDTPETVHPQKPPQCFGAAATARAKELLDSQEVILQADPLKPDRDPTGDRLLRYVWLSDGRMFNLVMVQEGFAYEAGYGEPYDHQQEFREAQLDAKNGGRGLWSPSTCNGQRYRQ
ncbi:MAG: thermonuclease family protein [Candidatus Binataceae bacterium]